MNTEVYSVQAHGHVHAHPDSSKTVWKALYGNPQSTGFFFFSDNRPGKVKLNTPLIIPVKMHIFKVSFHF